MSESTNNPQEATQKKEAHAATGRQKVAAPAVTLDEKAIDAPSIQTLIMLTVIALATLTMWAAGRAACNYHVPGESLTPRSYSLEDRTRTPKGVGIEFAQALSGADFEVATQLALRDVWPEIEAEKASCKECEDRLRARPHLRSVAIVHKANSIDSIVEVTTLGHGSEKKRFLSISREGRKWQVTRIHSSLDTASLKEAPFSSGPRGLPGPFPSLEEGREEEAASRETEEGDATETDASSKETAPARHD